MPIDVNSLPAKTVCIKDSLRLLVRLGRRRLG